jgi:sucrose-6-phosphate hydrolase SacC (GH32 family)
MPAALILAMLTAGQAKPYHEPTRPQFHFTAQSGWLNDPNGLVFFRGEYHLFFQHNPFGTVWGNMTWGHAVSKDLLHWNQLPEAIPPDDLGTIFSGSAVVDTENTSGFGSKSQPPLVCIYTAAGGTSDASKGKPFTQCLAYSVDGRNFTKFSGNPVLPHQVGENRDPKVTWYAPTKQWVMALYLDGSKYGLFGSPDLKTWSKLSEVDMPGAGECPDFFELPVNGDKKQTRWVFWSAPGLYRVGTFDGTTFHPETDCLRTNWGNTSYAAQTYANDPKGRRVQIAWLNNSNFTDVPWNQQMGIPTELGLRATSQGPRLTIQPVDEVRSLRGKQLPTPVALSQVIADVVESDSGRFDIEAEASIQRTGWVNFKVNGVSIRYDAGTQTLTGLDKSAPLALTSDQLRLRILVDRASVEIFAQGGLVYMPLFTLPRAESKEMIFSSSSDATFESLKVWPVRSVWGP